MVDAASGGPLVSKTPTNARNLLYLMAQNTQQFGARESQIKSVNEICSRSSIESLLSYITTTLINIVTRGVQKAVI